MLLCSKEAGKQRVYAGMKLSEARAVCADLVWREYDESLYQALQRDLLHMLVAVSPKVAALEPGTFLLDASGMAHLGGEEKFCRRIQKLVSVAGFPEVHTGLADSAFPALVASKFKRQNHFIVPVGQNREFLASLSVCHLPREFELADTLLALGIKTMGQLLSMPITEVSERFGAAGLRAYDLAQGSDIRLPESVSLEQEFHSAVELGFPVQALQQTQFILKSMLVRLCDELKENGLHCNTLSVAFFNESDKFDERPVKLIRPSNSPVFLLELIKLSLESRKLTREITGIRIEVNRFSAENWQQSQVKIKQSSLAAAALLLNEPAQVQVELPELVKDAFVELEMSDTCAGNAGEIEPVMMFNREVIYADWNPHYQKTQADDFFQHTYGEEHNLPSKALPLKSPEEDNLDASFADGKKPTKKKGKTAASESKRKTKKAVEEKQLVIHSLTIETEAGQVLTVDEASQSASLCMGAVHVAMSKPCVASVSDLKLQQQSKVGSSAAGLTDAASSHFVIDSENVDQAEPMALLLQRFISRLGAGALVRSVPNDQHLPDFAGAWLPIAEDISSGAVLPLDCNYSKSNTPFACGLVLKKSPTPEPVLVELKGQLPQAITYQGRWYRIRELTEPEKLSGLWWENPVCKSYYVALIEAPEKPAFSNRSARGGALRSIPECAGLLVLLVRVHTSNSWQIEGFFD